MTKEEFFFKHESHGGVVEFRDVPIGLAAVTRENYLLCEKCKVIWVEPKWPKGE